MSKITKLEVQKRNKEKVNLFLDNEFRCGLTAESVVRARLKVGDDITEAALEDIFLTSESEIAFGKACDYISRAMKTVKQIKNYLSKKGFEPTVIANVVKKLKEYRYVDDEYFAELYANANSATKGKRRISIELAQKGIKKELAEQAAEALPPEIIADNAKTLADKYMRNKDFSPENLVKLQRYLLSRGYDYDVIGEILRAFRAEID